MSITRDSKLIKRLIKNDNGIRYNWEDVKKELFKNMKADAFKRTKKVSKKSKR